MDRTALQQEISRLRSQSAVLGTRRWQLLQEQQQLAGSSLDEIERRVREERLQDQLRSVQSILGAIQQELTARGNELRALDDTRSGPARGEQDPEALARADVEAREQSARDRALAERERAAEEAATAETLEAEERLRNELAAKDAQVKEELDRQASLQAQERERQALMEQDEHQRNDPAGQESPGRENLISETVRDVGYSIGQTGETWREVADGVRDAIEQHQQERQARVAEFQQRREDLLARFHDEQRELRETQQRAAADVAAAMEQSGWSPEARAEGMRIQQEAFREQWERQERQEQERLDQLARQYDVDRADRYQELSGRDGP
jgi:hypothetical protein